MRQCESQVSLESLRVSARLSIPLIVALMCKLRIGAEARCAYGVHSELQTERFVPHTTRHHAKPLKRECQLRARSMYRIQVARAPPDCARPSDTLTVVHTVSGVTGNSGALAPQ